MKPAGAPLIALLLTRQFVQTDLYTITLANGGTVVRYTTAQYDIFYSGQTYTAGRPAIDSARRPARGHWKIGMDVDTWNFTVMPRALDAITGATYPDTLLSQPWLSAVRAGALDGATLLVQRAYFPSWPTPGPVPIRTAPTGVITLFYGRIANVQAGRTSAEITANSFLELLQAAMPRNIWQAACRHTLFDTGCGISAGSFGAAGTVQVNSTQSTIFSSAAAPSGSGTYALGRIVFTTGQNTGFQQMVRAYGAGSPLAVVLLAPMPFPVTVGDAHTLYPGCDKQLTTCALFANTANFGGQPYIPAPETAV